MSNVTLSIGGRQFTVACAEGEETHVTDLGRMIDGKVQSMGDMSSQGEARMLLFAALLLADEVYEAKRSEGRQSTQADMANETAERIEAMAEELENIVSRLEC